MHEELEQVNQVYNTIIDFITNYSFQLIGALLIVIIGIIALDKLGISIAPFIAAVGALSLTAGLALQVPQQEVKILGERNAN
nr:hypothetical protein [Sulfurimonas sp. SAG-AH-194-L11]